MGHLRSLRRNHDKTYTKKSWQNIYDEEVMTKHIRWNHDKSFTFMFDKAYTMKSWQIIYVHVWQSIYEEVLTNHLRSCLTKHIRRSHVNSMRWENRWDLTSSPKHYFCVIYTHYDEEVLTKHLRSFRWRSHENSWGEKRG